MDASLELTPEERAFAHNYIKENFRVTRAADSSSISHDRARSMLSSAHVRNYIDQLLDSDMIQVRELLAVMSNQVRADVGDYLSVVSSSANAMHPESVDPEFFPEGAQMLNELEAQTEVRIDLAKMIEHKQTKLIKELKIDPKGGIHIKLHDPQKAIEQVGRYYRLWSDIEEEDVDIDLTQVSTEELQAIASGKLKSKQVKAVIKRSRPTWVPTEN